MYNSVSFSKPGNLKNCIIILEAFFLYNVFVFTSFIFWSLFSSPNQIPLSPELKLASSLSYQLLHPINAAKHISDPCHLSHLHEKKGENFAQEIGVDFCLNTPP